MSAGKDDLRIYPDPANELVNVSLPENETFYYCEIIDIFGKRVIIKDNIQTGNHLIVDISELSPGIYLVNLYTKETKFTKKLIVKR